MQDSPGPPLKKKRRSLMTGFILVIGGLAFGAICFGVGYLLGKKKKVIAQVTSVVGKASSLVDSVTAEVKKI